MSIIGRLMALAVTIVGANDITIEYYNWHNDKYLDKKSLGTREDM